jgi:glucose-6-phosphate dehydrogenase assembly protein OpcA
MPKDILSGNLLAQYFSKDAGKQFDRIKFIGATVGASVIASQIIARYTKNPTIAQAGGILTAMTGGAIPTFIYLSAYAPNALTQLRSRLN